MVLYYSRQCHAAIDSSPIPVEPKCCSGRSPVALVADLKVLPGVTPIVGGRMVVAHPHEALAAQHRLDGGLAHRRRCPCLRVLADRHPAQHHLAQPAGGIYRFLGCSSLVRIATITMPLWLPCHKWPHQGLQLAPECVLVNTGCSPGFGSCGTSCLQLVRQASNLPSGRADRNAGCVLALHGGLHAGALTSGDERAACGRTQSCGCQSELLQSSPGAPAHQAYPQQLTADGTHTCITHHVKGACLKL